MARYCASLETRLPAGEVFDYLSDFSNAEEWDPGTLRAKRVGDGAIGQGTEFQLVAAFLGRETRIAYRVIRYDPPYTLTLRGENSTVVSLDRIDVVASDTGARITYDAKLTMKGPLKIFDPLLAPAFRRVGDRALEGMRATFERMEVQSEAG